MNLGREMRIIDIMKIDGPNMKATIISVDERPPSGVAFFMRRHPARASANRFFTKVLYREKYGV
jgi:hypothetical protein